MTSTRQQLTLREPKENPLNFFHRFTSFHSLIVLLYLLPVTALAQTPQLASGWERLKALPVHTRVHVSADKMSRTCNLVSVDDDTLVCSKSRLVSTAHYTFARQEVKSVKLTRYIASTLVGIGVGAGVGAILGRVVSPPNKNAFLDFSSITRDAFTVGGAVAGGAAGGPTDFLRGPTVYQRPKAH
jgi:hypothetical protein